MAHSPHTISLFANTSSSAGLRPRAPVAAVGGKLREVPLLFCGRGEGGLAGVARELHALVGVLQGIRRQPVCRSSGNDAASPTDWPTIKLECVAVRRHWGCTSIYSNLFAEAAASLGWEVEVMKYNRREAKVRVRFVHATDEDGRRYAPMWLMATHLRELPEPE